MKTKYSIKIMIALICLMGILIACQAARDETPSAPTPTVVIENSAFHEALGRGIANREQGEYAAALENFGQAIELDPNNPNVYNERGKASIGMGNFNAAISDFTKAIELAADFVDAYLNRALVYSDYNYRNFYANNASALSDLNQVIEINRDNAFAYAMRGNVYYHLGNHEAALEDWYEAESLGYELPADIAANRELLQDR